MDDASVEPMVMPLGLLREITNGFSEDRKLGSGSFGKVYEGIYQNGEKIAVKILYDMPGLDDEQFQNEFKHLARLQHPNIVRLVGYCHDIQEVQVQCEGKLVLAEKTHRALCLEFMSNGSLEKLLSDECDRYDWHTCYRIIKGICQGLKYLHDELKPPIYHLDLKPANVLLDENMVPRIADFGISRLFSDEQTWATKSSLGTIGYSPPEFMRSNLISNKFDIFSLGVVIIKMMAGRAGYFSIVDMSSQEFTNIVQEKWTNRLLETSNRRSAYSEQVKICIQIGLSCVQEDRHQRPTIQDIVYRLEESETKCTAAARKEDHREGDLVRVLADSESKITCGEGIPPFSEQQPTVLEVEGEQSVSAMFMFRQEPYRKTANASGSNAKFHLRFLDGLKTPVYTEENITSESNSAIRIAIFDGDGNMVREGPLSKAKVEVLVLRGDFFNNGRDSWTEEEFNGHVVQGQHGQGFVLEGDCGVWLNNGEASFGGFQFKEGSYRTRSRRFVLGARVCMDKKTADRVREAIMKPVSMLDRRHEANNEKMHPPELDDEVYRLEEISKGGIYRKRLNKAQIFTVEDFLKALNKDGNKLREEVLQIMKHSRSWEKMVQHARECYLPDWHELKAYQNVEGNVVLLFNCVHDLVGAIFDSVYIAQENFDPAKKALAYELKESARDELDCLPFNYVMNGNLPEQVPPSTHSLDAAILVPIEAFEVSGNQLHDRMINYVTEPSHNNEYFHGDQNTVNTLYYSQGEGIPPLLQQQPTVFAALQHWNRELSDWSLEVEYWSFEGSGPTHIHSQMQAVMAIDGGGAMEASTSVQNNLLPQQFLPNQFQESMPGMHYSQNLPNPVAEPSTWHDELEPSVYPFPGPGYGDF